MGKKINVIDLDKTLLPYHSLVRFVVYFMSEWRCVLPLLAYSLLRITGVMGKDTYLKKVLMSTRTTERYEEKLQRFSQLLYRDVRQSMVGYINTYTDDSTTTILCTASPQDYVKYLCEKLQWEYLCSTLNAQGNGFVHMSGAHKIHALHQQYPEQQYTYHFALSDNNDDAELLQLFDTSYRVKNSLLRKKFSYISVKKR